MTFTEFKDSLTKETPPAELTLTQQALWQAGKGNWHGSHDLLQNDKSADGAWVHAYLHREEGDLPNARHWYNLAGRPECTKSLADEWGEIAAALI